MRSILAIVGILLLAACASMPATGAGYDAAAREVLAAYQRAVVARDLTGTEDLFAPGAVIVEQGHHEGDFAAYREHHLGPELAEFRDFRFDNYEARVVVHGDVAQALETYTYHIVANDGRAVDRQGAATSSLARGPDGRWRITQYHSSSRAITPSQ